MIRGYIIFELTFDGVFDIIIRGPHQFWREETFKLDSCVVMVIVFWCRANMMLVKFIAKEEVAVMVKLMHWGHWRLYLLIDSL